MGMYFTCYCYPGSSFIADKEKKAKHRHDSDDITPSNAHHTLLIKNTW